MWSMITADDRTRLAISTQMAVSQAAVKPHFMKVASHKKSGPVVCHRPRNSNQSV